MDTHRATRWMVPAVAAPFITGGLTAILFAFMPDRSQHQLAIPGVLAVAVGIGLLRKRPAWRVVAVAILCLQAVGVLGLGIVSVNTDEALTLALPGHSLGFEGGGSTAFLLSLLVLDVASLWILLRPAVRHAFVAHTQPAHRADGES